MILQFIVSLFSVVASLKLQADSGAISTHGESFFCPGLGNVDFVDLHPTLNSPTGDASDSSVVSDIVWSPKRKVDLRTILEVDSNEMDTGDSTDDEFVDDTNVHANGNVSGDTNVSSKGLSNSRKVPTSTSIINRMAKDGNLKFNTEELVILFDEVKRVLRIFYVKLEKESAGNRNFLTVVGKAVGNLKKKKNSKGEKCSPIPRLFDKLLHGKNKKNKGIQGKAADSYGQILLGTVGHSAPRMADILWVLETLTKEFSDKHIARQTFANCTPSASPDDFHNSVVDSYVENLARRMNEEFDGQNSDQLRTKYLKGFFVTHGYHIELGDDQFY